MDLNLVLNLRLGLELDLDLDLGWIWDGSGVDLGWIWDGSGWIRPGRFGIRLRPDWIRFWILIAEGRRSRLGSETRAP